MTEPESEEQAYAERRARRFGFPHLKASDVRFVDVPAAHGIIAHRDALVTTACGKEMQTTLVTRLVERIRCIDCLAAMAADAEGDTKTELLARRAAIVAKFRRRTEGARLQARRRPEAPVKRGSLMENDVMQAWEHIDPDIQAGAEQDPAPQQILFAVTREMAEEVAGRPVTDEEAERIANAIPFSSVPGALSEIVSNVCHFTG